MEKKITILPKIEYIHLEVSGVCYGPQTGNTNICSNHRWLVQTTAWNSVSFNELWRNTNYWVHNVSAVDSSMTKRNTRYAACLNISDCIGKRGKNKLLAVGGMGFNISCLETQRNDEVFRAAAEDGNFLNHLKKKESSAQPIEHVHDHAWPE